MPSEFDLIARYFVRAYSDRSADRSPAPSRVALGIGDDCALLPPMSDMQLAISTDMLVEGRHFFTDADPAALGHKSLAVNLSDLAAMGAKPLAFTLALAGRRREIELDAETLHEAAQRLHAPTPRVAMGLALRGIAHAAIDVSDGLTGDLGHILQASHVGAALNADALPAGPMLARRDTELRRRFALAGGDDYELYLTAPAARREAVLAAANAADTAVTRIGRIEAEPGLRLFDATGRPLALKLQSFDHFST